MLRIILIRANLFRTEIFKPCFSLNPLENNRQEPETTDDEFAILKNYTRKENFTKAQQFCDGSLNGNLTKTILLVFTENNTLPSSTGWIGLALSNSTFLWYSNQTAFKIVQCLSGLNSNGCLFNEYINKNTGVLFLSRVDLACSACEKSTAVFFACVKGND